MSVTDDFSDVIGSKGGSSAKGGGKGAVKSDAANTLRSKARARITELLGEGEIVGLVDGAKSIFFDQTALQNKDGSFNFKGVEWQQRTGLPDQEMLTGSVQAETPYTVGVELKKAQEPPVRTIGDRNADAVRVVVNIPALFHQDQKTGSVQSWTTGYQIEVQNANGGWGIALVQFFVFQKTMAPYQKAHRIALDPKGYPWNIRVRKIVDDAADDATQNSVYWDSYTELVEGKFTYPNSAIVAMELDAENFGSSIPARYYDVKGLIIQVPDNYNPETRTYNGVWQGTFKRAWTNNPAWVLYDLLTNNRYGLGEFVDAARIDKWGLYEIAQYCDQSVPDGYGGFEPRFTYNGVINSRDEAYKVLQNVVQVFRGMAFWSLGQVFAVADMPRDYDKIFSPANVIDGVFSYSGTAKKARHSVAMVGWNDPLDFYRTAIEVVQHDDALDRFGWRQTDVQAVGCTSRGQAHRFGKWILDTEHTATETVEFECALEVLANDPIRPGHVIAVADPRKAQVRLGGRVEAANGSRVQLDKAFERVAGESYKLTVTLPSGELYTSDIVGWEAEGLVAVLGGTPPEAVAPFASWAITGTDVAPRQYRVISVREDKKNTFKVTALFHDPLKYARVEQGIVLDPIRYTRPKPNIKAPTNLKAVESTYLKDGVARSRVLLSWTPADDFLSARYTVRAQTPTGERDYGEVGSVSIDINDVDPGVYTFEVTAIGIDGKLSPPATLEFEAKGWGGLQGPKVANLRVKGGGTTFSGRDCVLEWDQVWPDGVPVYDNDFVVRIVDAKTDEIVRQQVVPDQTFSYTFENNRADGGPRRTFKVRVSARDNLGRESQALTITATNPAPAAVVPTLMWTTENVAVRFDAPNDPDFSGDYIWMEKTQGFDPRKAKPVYDGPNTLNFLPAAPDTTYYVRVACYDVFGKDPADLNVSAEFEVRTSSFPVDTSQPDMPTGLRLETVLEISATGVATSAITAYWNPVTSDNLGRYQFELSEGTGTSGSWQRNETGREQTTYTWHNLKPGQTYAARVRTMNSSGFATSAYSPIVTIVAAKNTAKPGKVSSLRVDSAYATAVLTWSNPTDRDLEFLEVWEGAGSPQKLLARIPAPGSHFVDAALEAAMTRTYWVRSINSSETAGDFAGPVAATIPQIEQAAIANGIIDATKIASSLRVIEALDALPTTGNFDGRMVSLSTDGKLYTFDAATGLWETGVKAGDIKGALSPEQMGEIDATKLIGKIVSDQIESVATDKLKGELQDAMLAGISASKIKGALTSDQIKELDAAKIAGRLSSDQIAGIEAAKLLGPVLATQIDKITAQQIQGQLSADQIRDLAASKLKIDFTPAQLALIDAARLGGQITSAQIAAIDAAKVQGELTAASFAAARLTGTLTYQQLAQLDLARMGGVLENHQVGLIEAAKAVGNLVNATLSARRLDGQLTSDQIENLAAAKVAGKLDASQIKELNANQLVGTVVDSQVAAGLSAAKVWGTLDNARIAAAALNGQITSDQIYQLATTKLAGKLTADQVESLRTNQLVGSIVNDQVAAGLSAAKVSGNLDNARLAASQLNGQVSSDQIAELSATKIAGQLQSWQIKELAANQIQGTIRADQLAQIPAGQISGQLQSWQIAGLTAAQLTTRIERTNIADNAIDTPQLNAGAVRSAQIYAGAVTTSKLAVASRNLLYASDFGQGLTGITWANSAGVTDPSLSIHQGSSWTFNRSNALNLHCSGGPVGSLFDVYLRQPKADRSTAYYPVIAGQNYEWSAYFSMHRANGYVYLTWFDAAGNNISSVTGNYVADNGASGGNEATFPRSGLIARAPGNAAFALPCLRLQNTGGTDAYAFASMPMLAVARDGQVELSPYVPSGVTVIDGGSITTDSLHASKIVAGSITTDRMSANTINADRIASGTITVDKMGANSVDTAQLRAGSIVADKIAAGAVTTNKLTVMNRELNFVGFNFRYVKAIRQIQWDAGEIYYRDDDNQMRGVGVAGGSFTVSGANWYGIFWGKGKTNLDWNTDINWVANHGGPNYITIATYDNGTGLAVNFGSTIIDGDRIVTGSIYADRLVADTITSREIGADAVTARAILAEAVVTRHMKAGTIEADRLVANSITVNQMGANSVDTAQLRAGSIIGDKIAAGAVTTNKLTVMNRELNFVGFNFRYVKAVNQIQWDAGAIYYRDDDDQMRGVNVTAGAMSPSGWTTLLWYKGKGSLDYTGDINYGSNDKNWVTLATYSGGTQLAVNFGATIIDGDRIVTNSIYANRLVADTITSREIGADSITTRALVSDAIVTRHMKAGTIDADRLVANSITTNQLGVNSVRAGQIDAGAVRAREIAAGSIVASKLAIASSNLAANGDLSQGTFGWQAGAGNTGRQPIVDGIQSGWAPPGMRSFSARYDGIPAANNTVAEIIYSTPNPNRSTSRLPVTGDTVYEFSAYISAHRCVAYVSVIWFDGNGNYITEHGGKQVSAQYGAGQSMALWNANARSWVIARSPANAASCDLRVRFGLTWQNGPYCFVAGLMFAQAVDGQTEPSPYVDPGLTTIDGGSLVTRSINADRIATRSLTANEIFTNTITANEIAFGTLTGDRIAGNTIKGTNIEAGTLTAREIKAASITTNLLTVANREINIVGFNFRYVKATRRIEWDGGNIYYRDDDNGIKGVTVGGNSFTVSGSQWYSIIWYKGRNYLDYVPDINYAATSGDKNWVTIATYDNGTGLAVNHGPSIIDGDRINTGSIEADRIKVRSLTANQINAYSITAYEIAFNTLTGDKIIANEIRADHIKTNSLTANQIAGDTIIGWNIKGDTIEAGHLKANSVTATQIAAGSISTSKLQIATSNFAFNGDMAAGTLGFSAANSTWGSKVGFGVENNWLAAGMKGLYAVAPGWAQGGYFDVIHRRVDANRNATNFPCVANQPYEFSVYGSSHRCIFEMYVCWCDANGTWFTTSGAAQPEMPRAGGTMRDYPRLVILANAPSNAVSFFVIYRGGNVKAADPYIFPFGFMYAAAQPGQREASPYVAPSLTTIDGGTITTGSIYGDRIVARSLKADQIEVGTITATEIHVGSISGDRMGFRTLTGEKIDVRTLTGDHIVGSTITGYEIAGNTIRADHIIAGEIQARHLAAASIAAVNIQAGAITASKLILTDPSNMVLNGDFINGTSDGWDLGQNSVIEYSGNEADPGGRFRLRSNSRDNAYSNRIAVTPGDVIYASAMVYNKNGERANLLALLTDGNGGGAQFPGFAYTDVKNGWVRIEGQITIPAGIQRMQVLLQTEKTQTYGSWTYWGKVQCRRASGAQLIVDGAITANKVQARTLKGDHLEAGTVTAYEVRARTLRADHIAFNTLTGDEMRVNSIEADRLKVNSITASQIRAGAIGVDQLAAGSIVADKLGVGLNSTNLIFNSDFKMGGSAGQAPPNITWGTNYDGSRFSIGINMSGPSWEPAGMRSLQINTGDSPNGNISDVHLKSPNLDGGWDLNPMLANRRYEASVYLSAHRCKARVYVVLYDANNNYVGEAAGNWVDDVASSGPLNAWARSTVFFNTPGNCSKALFFIRTEYYGRQGPYTFITGAYMAPATNAQSSFSDWAPSATTVITGKGIQTGSIDAEQIRARSLTADRIAFNTLTGDQINANTISGWHIQSNSIYADKIQIGSGWSLTSWLGGNGNTEIRGDMIAANSIAANKMKIGARGLNIQGIEFQARPGSNTVSWSDGRISYVDDNGNNQESYIPAGNTSYWGGWLTLGWFKGRGNLDWCWDANGGWRAWDNNPDFVPFAVYTGGAGLVVTKGGTIIDGSKITTGSIQAGQIAAGAINAGHIGAGQITAGHIGAGQVTADKISGGVMQAGTIKLNDERLWIESYNGRPRIVVSDGQNLRMLIGNTSGFTPRGGDWGLVIWGNDNKYLFGPDGINGDGIWIDSINADKINAGSLKAKVGQFDDLIVRSAQIGQLVVGTSNIANEAVTSFASGATMDNHFDIWINNRNNRWLSITFAWQGSNGGYMGYAPGEIHVLRDDNTLVKAYPTMGGDGRWTPYFGEAHDNPGYGVHKYTIWTPGVGGLAIIAKEFAK